MPNRTASRFQVGDSVAIYKPGYTEHGWHGIVSEVITIEEYYHGEECPVWRGPHAYKTQDGWKDSRPGREGWGCGGFLPDIMVTRW